MNTCLTNGCFQVFVKDKSSQKKQTHTQTYVIIIHTKSVDVYSTRRLEKSHVFLNRYISLDPYKVRNGKKDLCMHIIILCMLETKPCLACKHTTNMAKLKVKILTIKLHVS